MPSRASRTGSRPRVIALLGSYWPQSSSSGPNQSFRALCEALQDEFDFTLVARDRPFGTDQPLAGPGPYDLGFATARYLPVGQHGAEGLTNLLRSTPHDLLLINGFFDREFTIPTMIARRAARVPRRPTILSPRGEFAQGALSLKSRVKRTYRAAAHRLGLLQDVWLHATGPREAADIAREFPWSKGILQAPNVRLMIDPPPGARTRQSGEPLRLAFLGRISPVKNLDFALRALEAVRSPVVFSIYGPPSDPVYWAACQKIITGLPPHVQAIAKGELDYEQVPSALAQHDLLFLPTLGENFGHAIFEALACGLPALISDQTPWQDLERKKAGWSLPLASSQPFAEAIDRFAAFDPVERQAFHDGARAEAEAWVRRENAVDQNRRMLRDALGSPA